jgi:hypothetical protein
MPTPALIMPFRIRTRLASQVAASRHRVVGAMLGIALLLEIPAAFAQLADPTPFDALLRANVNAGQVHYPGFQEAPGFKRYLSALAQPAPFTDRAAELAYYINAYNALAIAGILDGLSPSTILGRARFFKLKEWSLAGRSVTLYDLEHKLLRPLNEPRIHFAIICASKSCPFLRSEVYGAAKLDAQLDDQARAFVNDRFRNRFDKATKTAQLSEIFKWYDEDFRAAGSVQKYLARYVADPEVARELAADGYQVEWIAYDWSLNGTPPRP